MLGGSDDVGSWIMTAKSSVGLEEAVKVTILRQRVQSWGINHHLMLFIYCKVHWS